MPTDSDLKLSTVFAIHVGCTVVPLPSAVFKLMFILFHKFQGNICEPVATVDIYKNPQEPFTHLIAFNFICYINLSYCHRLSGV